MIGPLLEQARAMVPTILTDTVTLSRADGVTETALGAEVPLIVDVWTGGGLVQDTATNRQTVVIADAATVDRDALGYVCKMPIEVDVRVGDWVTVTKSLDPRHVGRRWKVTAVPTQAWALVQRCIIDPD